MTNNESDLVNEDHRHGEKGDDHHLQSVAADLWTRNEIGSSRRNEKADNSSTQLSLPNLDLLGHHQTANEGQQGRPEDRPQDLRHNRPDVEQQPARPQEKPAAPGDRVEAAPELNERETRLVDRMRERGATEAELRTFSQDLAEFRRRGPNAREVAGTLDQVERLMGSRGEHPVDQTERRRIAMQIVHHAAKPTEIDQGAHNTCNVTTLEERMFTRNPSRAAEMIVTASTTGNWVAPDGRRINLSTGGGVSFVPGAEERRTYPRDGERSHASQIFQNVAVNDATQRRNPPQFYRQDMTANSATDTGERLYHEGNVPVMATENGRRRHVSSPTLSDNEIAQIGRRLTGDRGYVISESSARTGGDSVTQISSQQDLVRQISDMQRRGQLPATIVVDANHTIFGGTGRAADTGQWHVVSVTGYDARSGMLQVSNQWGARNDRQISAALVYQSMRGHPRP